MALRIDDVDLERDRSLVHAVQAGDDEAFAALYRRYFARLRRFCAKRVGDEHEAEEVAQEAFVRAYRALPQLAGDRRFYPWLTVIADRLCVDHHRRRARVEPVAEVGDAVVDGALDARLLAAADRALLDAALARLSERHRDVLVLREREGWTYRAIAEHQGVSQSTIEMLIFRARQALRREYQAVAGSDARWAGVPVLGWLLRRTADIRTRTAELAGAAGPVAQVAAAIAVAGSVAAFGGFVGPGDPTSPATAGASAAPAASTRAIASVEEPAPAELAASAPVEEAQAPAAGPQGGDAGLGTAPVRARGVAIGDDGHGRGFNDSAPVGTTVGPVQVGADPAAVVESIDRAAGGGLTSEVER